MHNLRLPALFAVTLFVASGLLFLVQPMIARMVLPYWGGTSSVWTTCMLFFQGTLLLGYIYAHALPERLGMRRHAVIHLFFMCALMLFLPVGVKLAPSLARMSYSAFGLLMALTLSVGLPFFVISSSGPLLQRWFTRTGHATSGDPYYLFAASNLGSMLALLSYPYYLEPAYTLDRQSRLWTAGYALLTLLTAGCIYFLKPEADEAGSSALADARHEHAPTWRERGWWILLSAVPSSLMLSVTMYLTTDLAAIPLLWVVPLALYLLTFVAASMFPTFLARGPLAYSLPLVVLFLVISLLSEATEPLWLIMVIHLSGLFWIGLVCHGELFRTRPKARWLTEFYLWLGLGGFLGGAFNALLAPMVFSSQLEYPLVLTLLAFLPLRHPRDRVKAPVEEEVEELEEMEELAAEVPAAAAPAVTAPSAARMTAPAAGAATASKAPAAAAKAAVAANNAIVAAPPGKPAPVANTAPKTPVANAPGSPTPPGAVKPPVVNVAAKPVANVPGTPASVASIKPPVASAPGSPTTPVASAPGSPTPAASAKPPVANTPGAPATPAKAPVEPAPEPPNEDDDDEALDELTEMEELREPIMARVIYYTIAGGRRALKMEPPSPSLRHALASSALIRDGQGALLLAFLIIVLSGLARYLNLPPGPSSNGLALALPAIVCYLFVDNPRQFGIGIVTLLLFASSFHSVHGLIELRARSFFGIHKVTYDNDKKLRALIHGNTIHGRQSLDPKYSKEPLTYYHPSGPMGRFFFGLQKDKRLDRVALVGMGTASLAYYGKAGQHWTFFEIDPSVVQIARDSGLFTFFKDSPAKVDVVIGDARLELASSPDKFGVIVLDAFSSDAIPTHLLTREAIATFRAKLSDNGLLAFHVSNRYLDLVPLLQNLAAQANPPMQFLVWPQVEIEDDLRTRGKEPSTWVVLAPRKQDVDLLTRTGLWQLRPGDPQAKIWTDDFINLFDVWRKEEPK